MLEIIILKAEEVAEEEAEVEVVKVKVVVLETEATIKV